MQGRRGSFFGDIPLQPLRSLRVNKIACVFLLLIFLAQSVLSAVDHPPSVFRWSLNSTPQNLDPGKYAHNLSTYFISQIYGSLLNTDGKKITAGLAEKCFFQGLKKVRCLMGKSKFSNGSPIKSSDFLVAAEKLSGRFPFPTFRAKATKDLVLDFELEENTPGFLYLLTIPWLTAFEQKTLDFSDPEKLVTSGPYQIQKWVHQKSITLAPNPGYVHAHRQRPFQEIQIIPEDMNSYFLFQKQQLDFLRRLPFPLFEELQHHKNYVSQRMWKMDALVLSDKIPEHIRQTLIRHLDYQAWQKLLAAPPRPGCLGVPSFLSKKPICVDSTIHQNPRTLQPQPPSLDFTYSYSLAGGEHHRMNAEWLQHQWKTHLGWELKINPLENQTFLSSAHSGKLSIYYKNISIFSPYCLEILQRFSEESKDPVFVMNDPRWKQILNQLKVGKIKSSEEKLCSEALNLLMKQDRLIPAGPMDFSYLIQSSWKGLSLNPLNQLDLRFLHTH